jgi:hypothetical protein
VVKCEPEREQSPDRVADDVDLLDADPVEDGLLDIGDRPAEGLGPIGDRCAEPEAWAIHQQESAVRELSRERGDGRPTTKRPVGDEQRWTGTNLDDPDPGSQLPDVYEPPDGARP